MMHFASFIDRLSNQLTELYLSYMLIILYFLNHSFMFCSRNLLYILYGTFNPALWINSLVIKMTVAYKSECSRTLTR